MQFSSKLVCVKLADRSSASALRLQVDLNLKVVAFFRRFNMESLRQWANLSGGVAIKAEECRGLDLLFDDLKNNIDTPRQRKPQTVPAGINGWTMLMLLACLCAEWLLRKRWELI